MSNNTSTQETRKFKMHNNLIHTIIFKQSGSVEKAITELLMNSIDANSTKIDISYDTDNNSFVIADDGKGFTTDEEIEAFFDTLGTPHKNGDAKFGRFRIGRTQIFAYASTVWRSGTYKMSVDFLGDSDENELGYKLEKNLPFQKGCIITGNRYSGKQLGQNMIDSLSMIFRTVLNEYFPYSDIPIYLNSELKITANNQCQWDLETDNAYYKFNNYRGAVIYNMGAFVKSYDGSYFGTGVDVITKKALDINFARNDIILYNCKVFKEISTEIKDYVNKTALKKNKLNQEEKRFIFNQFINGELEYHQVRNIKLFTDVFEKDFSFEEFVKAKRVTFSDGKSGKLAERVHESKTALVFNANFSYLFGNNDFGEFIRILWDLICSTNGINKDHPSYNLFLEDRETINKQKCIGNIKSFESSFSTKHEILETFQLTKKEQILLKSIRRLNDIFYKEYQKILNTKKRKVVFGDSLVSNAWTDGTSYIAINKKFIPIFDYGIKSFDYILKLIIHEYCHNDFTINEHPHNQEFYKMYHDITINGGFKELKDGLIDNISNLPKRASLVYHNDLESNNINAPKKLKQELSHIQDNQDNQEIEFFLSSFSDYFWKETDRTFEDFIQEHFIMLENDLKVLQKYTLTKNKILETLTNNESFDTRDLFIKIDNINNFIDFIIANLVKRFKTKTLAGIIKNIDSLIEEYNKRDRDYNIEEEIRKELKEHIDYRKALKFIYKNTKAYSYLRHSANDFHFCIVENNIYNRLKEEYEVHHPTLFEKINIDKNLKEKLDLLKDKVKKYDDIGIAKHEELKEIKSTLPTIKTIISNDDYLAFEALGYIDCLKKVKHLSYENSNNKYIIMNL